MSEIEVREALEAWDQDQGRAMAHSEAVCGKRQQKNFWSPELRNAGITCRYWGLRFKEAKESGDYRPTILRLLRSAQQQDPNFSFPDLDKFLLMEDIILKWKDAKTALRTIQKSSKEIRFHSYHELLTQYENDTDPSTQQESRQRAKTVRTTMRAEEVRENFRNIKLAVKPFQDTQHGLRSIMVPMATSETHDQHPIEAKKAYPIPRSFRWETIIDRSDIETYVLEYNRNSFRAASTSPCGHGVIMDSITFNSVSPAGRAILDGAIPSQWYGNQNLFREFLTSFMAPQEVKAAKPINTRITQEDIRIGFGRCKENKSTSPSGRHLGHYKAVLQDNILLDCLKKFLDVAVSRGISISRWQNAVNIMLEKDMGTPKIHRLRIIHLFEADFNYLLKILWGSRLIRRATKLNLLNDGQHGSVPGKNAIELVMLNQISNDICRTQKINIIRFENDASACYDRILVPLGMLAAGRCGMPENAIKVHANTLHKMKYRVKTIYGVSDDWYQGTVDAPLFGTGQGSGASPAVWLTLVVILMNTLDRVIPHRIRFRSPDDNYSHARLIDAFVDDTSLAFTETSDKMSHFEMVKTIEKAAKTWQKLLFYSGGSLNLNQCSWSNIYWTWKNGQPQLRQPADNDATVSLQSEDGVSSSGTPIKYTSPSTPIRMLGVHLCPTGDFTAHLHHMKGKADRYAKCIQSSRITTSELLTFHKTIYTPSMIYSLPALSVNEAQMSIVQQQLMATVLNKLGASCKTPTAIRHGPTNMGGLNLLDLRTEVGIANIRFLRKAVYNDSEAGRLLIIISLKYSQLEAGIQAPLLANPSVSIPYITQTWLTSVRTFASTHSIKIHLTNTLKIRFNGAADECIMNPILLQHYTTQQQTDINLVRLYLQVLTLADMSLPSGHDIQNWALEGVRYTDSRPLSNNMATTMQSDGNPASTLATVHNIKLHSIRYKMEEILRPYQGTAATRHPGDT